MENQHEIATLAGGCFWCIEAVFRRLKGVGQVTPGYSGGHVAHPTFQQVAGQKTGHAEAVQIEFDPNIITFSDLLEVFFALHDPTTLNRQGNDVGPEYRSAIFYHSEVQKEIAMEKIAEVNRGEKYSHPLVTEVTKFDVFYPASQEHKDFYEKNRTNGYCRYIIDPKITKLYKDFGAKLKPEYMNEKF